MSTQAIRVLLVEDDADTALFERMMLESSPACCHVRHARNLAEATELLKHNNFDVVLLDLILVGAGAADVLGFAQAASTHAPVVVMTGLSDRDVAAQMLRGVASDYVEKGTLKGVGLMQVIERAIKAWQIEGSMKECGATPMPDASGCRSALTLSANAAHPALIGLLSAALAAFAARC